MPKLHTQTEARVGRESFVANETNIGSVVFSLGGNYNGSPVSNYSLQSPNRVMHTIISSSLE